MPLRDVTIGHPHNLLPLGMQQGVKQGEARTLLRLLDQKFGPEAAQAHRERIETAELEQLDTWLGRILTAETPEIIFH